jgi:hypothetical protein
MVGFPLLLIPLAIYNMVVFLMHDVSFTEPLFRLTLPSGAAWPVTLSDMLIALGMVLLLLEVIKGARPGAKYLMDHLLSLVVFGAAAAEFVLWPKFANSTFFLLTLLAMADFFAGVALRIKRPARRSIAAAPIASESGAPEPHVEAPAVPEKPETESAAEEVAPASDRVPTESRIVEPEAPAEVPAAASVAESVLMDHSGPRSAQAATAQGEPPAERAVSKAETPAIEAHGEPAASVASESPKEPEVPKP